MTDQKARGSCWSVTINNPTPADEEEVQLARQKGWNVEGQVEMGDNGTPHYQLMVKTPQVRFAAVKKAFQRAHIELARNPAALGEYVSKQETRVGELVEKSDKYPSVGKLWELIYHELTAYWKHDADERCCWGEWDRGRVKWLPHGKEFNLEHFDIAIEVLIRKGYNVEMMAVNPQIRGSFAKFPAAILTKAMVKSQSASHLVENVEIPVTQEYITNAHDNPPSLGSTPSELP